MIQTMLSSHFTSDEWLYAIELTERVEKIGVDDWRTDSEQTDDRIESEK